MSNSYCEHILKEFSGYAIELIEAKRAINPKKPNSKCTEVVINNWSIAN